ncbi:nickel pincer cofactor biosynthesis protein LarB [Alicyclobacillus fastidiosus]|uniref:Nickel pincer cofactor biosynthesis protein LarB n=1 Tax=Alicyclobacillus fastidiosus TaxID=392011 RepID=A0ABY6ZIY5_9BACL|nr:nickel pincer cofactor biosynthesis protein LarB [Alicyclobacillus fastidiosus]WAH42071.1 nickel pincer cofactor biosynthesis protein LarB [Alicyclobacillus fastidiosus]GMA63834.1 1-(5-phosphoribosyl)-5-amino-4-imidazole-carboxyl ate carboxylase [Alicyclobacillus fastidiosus]
MKDYREILEAVHHHRMSVDEGVESLRHLDVEDLGFAQLDHHRSVRQGFPEVVYCEGKTPAQSAAILARLAAHGQGPVLGTRANERVFELVKESAPSMQYDPLSRTVFLKRGISSPTGNVAVVCAGTSDLPVAEEAAITAELMGADVTRITDVGVAGIHRLFAHLDTLYKSRVLVVVAGMEGALVSVVAGLVHQPVIAVPTSVGYGTNFAGVTPLLSMLNSCSSGVGVVNIDNGFGAGYLAGMINRMGISA